MTMPSKEIVQVWREERKGENVEVRDQIATIIYFYNVSLDDLTFLCNRDRYLMGWD